MNENPLISVIVPIYNVEKYLDKCISSIVEQTYNNLEIILVDDGSNDACSKICDEWQGNDERIVVIHKENGGLSDARNAGMDVMTGKYVSFVDGDDYIDERYIEVLYNNLIRYNADISQVSFCREEAYSSNEICIETLDASVACKNFYISKMPQMMISSCAKLFKTDLISNQRFPKGRNFEDQFFTPRVVYCSHKIVMSNERLYNYINRQDSITHIPFNAKKIEDIIWVMKDNFQFFLNHNAYNMAAIFYFHRKKLISKLNIEAEEENLHNEVPKKYRQRLVISKIKYFIYMPFREKKSVVYSLLTKISKKSIV
ncbi:glycosyltransferase [uncultured Eubacterium sp.]|uniref:glycosyltransferase family 2 protein n=1 Tax=uncultured Eubacterium sp. TaxID=165185 RepID=UPI0015BC2618|nr:glycosyltransferase [uncultured Eubacterium sp.]